MDDSYETRELLNSTHSFPCEYLFKAIGTNGDNFVGRVVRAVRSELADDVEPSFSFRKTSAGRHVSVTIEPMVGDAEQIVAIYRNLRDLDGLVMLF